MFPGGMAHNSLAAIGVNNIMRIATNGCFSTGNPAVIASSSTIPAASWRQDEVINPPPPLIPRHRCAPEEVNITAHAAFFCQRLKFSRLSCPTTYSNVLWRSESGNEQVLQWNDRHLYA